MFRKILLVLGLLIASPTWAQNITCATRPAGDSSNACASTAFVQGSDASSIPATTNVLKGTGTAGSAAAATPGADYITPAEQTSALQSALPNATTCQPYGGTGAAGAAQAMALGTGLSCTGGTISAPSAIGTGYVWLGNPKYNAKCDGVTDDTAAIQGAWNDAAAANTDLWIGGVGTGTCMFSVLTMPTPTNGFVGNRAGISGAGKGVTTLQTTSTGTTCAIGMTGTASNEFVRVKFSGFRILGSTSGVAAIGICMNGVDGFAFEHVRFEGLTEGIEASDDIYISLIECEWYRINYAVNAFYGSSSHPNAWTFIDPYIEGAATYGLIFQNPTDLNILGGDFENNPGVSIYINGNPLEGTMGLNLSGGYFSLNSSPADVEISDGGSSINGVHTINGNEFQRISNSTFVTNNILLANTGSGVTTLNIRGNGFQGFNSYSPSSSRPYVTESNPGTNDYVIDSGGNWFQSSLETPAGAIWKETPWTAYTPTLGCGTGSLTTASATGSYKRLTPKTYAVEIVATVTTIGSCASYLTATLPTTANSAGVGNFRNTTTDYSGSIAVAAASSITTWFTSTGAIPVASGQVVEGSLVYESQ